MAVILRAMTLVWLCFAPAAFAAEPNTLRLAYQTGDVNTLTTYAQATRLFEKTGLNVTLVPFPAGPAILPAIASGEVDLGWFGEFPIVTGFANGIPLTTIMIDRLLKSNTRLIARNGSGIDRLGDLKGKKIGISIGSTSHQHVLLALKKVGLKQSDVTLVNLSPATIPAAFQAGQIDAAFTWEPNVSIIQKDGKVLATTESLGDISGVFLAGRTAFVKDHPDLVQKFLAAWDMAMADGTRSPDETRQYEAKRLGVTVPELGAMLDRMGVSNPPFREQLTASNLGTPDEVMTSRMMAHFRDVGAFLLAENRISALPKDWSKVIDVEPLRTYLSKKP